MLGEGSSLMAAKGFFVRPYQQRIAALSCPGEKEKTGNNGTFQTHGRVAQLET